MNLVHPDVIFFLNSDLTNYTTFKLKSSGDIAIVKSLNGLKCLLEYLKKNARSYRLIGWGANQILPLKIEPLLIKLDLPFDENIFNSTHDTYDLPASVGLNYLTAHALKFGLIGWEVITGIPASLGGAIYMNAGTALGEISQLLKDVTLMKKDGSIKKININNESFSYRKNHFVDDGEIIIGATLKNFGLDSQVPDKIKKYLEYRKSTQPLSAKTCGCVFKNYSEEMKAGKTIDELGLKGLAVGPLKISHKHSNFMENSGGATAEDFFKLIKMIQEKVKKTHGIEFELEVKIE